MTGRKVYAMGARVAEIPLPRPGSGAVEEGLAELRLPNTRNSRRRMYRRLNHCAIPGYAPLCMDSNDPETVECAFKQRLMRHVPVPKKGILGRLRLFVRHWLRENVRTTMPMDFEEWLESTSYNEERKKQLRSVHDELRGGKPTKELCRRISTFVKSEYYPTWKHARMINSRHDAFKVWSGPRFKAIENVVYGIPEFIKHVPVPERPAKIAALKQAGRKYYQTDFTAFESHFTPQVLRCVECELYSHCLKNDADAKFLCDVICGTNSMRTRSGVHAEIEGRRMSGDMCTSLGNGFTNLMLAKFIAHEKRGKLVGFVEGDDGLFCTDVTLSSSDYEALGFTIKIEEVADPCEASFCGMIFSESGEIIREPRKFFQGFGWTQSFLAAGSTIMDQLLRAKALSTVYETPQCPIVGAIARYALSKTQHVSPRFVTDGYHNKEWVPRDIRDIPEFSPSYDTRLLFEREFGVSIPTQLIAEKAALRGEFGLIGTLVPPTNEQSLYTEMYVEIT